MGETVRVGIFDKVSETIGVVKVDKLSDTEGVAETARVAKIADWVDDVGAVSSNGAEAGNFACV